MRRSIGIAAGLLSFALLASPAAAQGKSELTVALSSFSTEVLDPVLGGHVVKYYMSLMFDYLVGVTPDGQLSKDAGLATRWEPSADHHWRIGVPRYKTVTFKLVPEETTRIALLRRGEVDITDVSRERVKELERESFPIHFRREEAVLTMWWILPRDGQPTKDKRVREALNLAIDRNEIAQSIFGGYADPAYVPLGLSWAYRDIGFKPTQDMQYPYDPTRAKKLLAEAGFASGFPLTMHAYQLPGLPEGKAFAEAMAGYWQKVGVQPKLVPVDYPAFRKNWFDRATPGAFGYYNVANRDWIGAYAFPEKQAYTKSKASDTVNDPEIDGMIEQVMRQTDKEKIATLMRNVYTRLRSEHYGVPVVYLHSPYAASKTLGKWNPGTVMYDFFLDELASSKR